jgi:hypothetical protein
MTQHTGLYMYIHGTSEHILSQISWCRQWVQTHGCSWFGAVWCRHHSSAGLVLGSYGPAHQLKHVHGTSKQSHSGRQLATGAWGYTAVMRSAAPVTQLRHKRHDML